MAVVLASLCLFSSLFLPHGAQPTKKNLGTVIGIDLGTTYSCVGVFKNCHVEILENDQGNRITPSCVAFTPDGVRLIGDAAKNLLTSNPENTIFHVKRILGRQFNETTVQQDIKHFPFKVIGEKNKPMIRVNIGHEEKLFAPEEISAIVLGKMRDIAERYLGTKVTHAVVTVPAYFNDAQRQATKDAGTIAGLNVLRIINEPTAASIAYGLDKMKIWKGAKNILVYDLGGGTLDVSLLTFDNGLVEVLATNGDTHLGDDDDAARLSVGLQSDVRLFSILGGEDFDQRVVEHFLQLIRTKRGCDLKQNLRAIEKLRREVEKAKRILSSEQQTRLEIESLLSAHEDFSEVLSRAKFEELNLELFRSTLVPVRNVLKDAKLNVDDIAEILLVGGSTRIPKVRAILKEFFNGKEPSRGINPDEAVAYGAAVQAAILAGDQCVDGDLVVMDVNPLTMGVEVKGGAMSVLIPRNTHIPVAETKAFTTTSDDQQVVTIRIFEGERPLTKDNHFLGEFDLTAIPRAARGDPQIDVTLDIDLDGILTVTAEERSKKSRRQIVINAKTHRLSTELINRMIRVAEIFLDEDKVVKGQLDARHGLEAYVYSLRNQLKDAHSFLEDLSWRDKSTLAEAIDGQIRWLDATTSATTDEYRRRQMQLGAMVTRITSDTQGQS